MNKAEDFIRLAKADLATSNLLLNSANDELLQNNAAYHTQQTTEKKLKSLLLRAGKPAGLDHNISALSKDLDELGIHYPEWVTENAYHISSWATTIRYNANFKSDHDLIEKINGLLEIWIREIANQLP